MLADILVPASNDDDELGGADEAKAAAERATASIDETMEPIDASEERDAAMETEGMKGSRR
jgi:hypothetical protein